MSAGKTAVWDGRDGANHSLPAGVYLARIQSVKSSGVRLIYLR